MWAIVTRKFCRKFCCIAALVLFVLSFLSSCSSPMMRAVNVEVRSSLEEYSWDELSILSKEFSSRSDKDRQELLERYHLVGGDGTLDGTQTKYVELEDGTKTQVRLIGFAHDNLSDKSGKAGFTFMFCEPVAQGRMNVTYTNEGGWEACAIRGWLNNDFVAKLPEDLAHNIVAVDKLTNNEGQPKSDSPVTTTSDTLWLLSVTELTGKGAMEYISRNLEPYAYAEVPEDKEERRIFYRDLIKMAEILMQEFAVLYEEGEQYSYFNEIGIEIGKTSPELAMEYEWRWREAWDINESWPWWCRSPKVYDAISKCFFYAVATDGTPVFIDNCMEVYGIVPCFCV